LWSRSAALAGLIAGTAAAAAQSLPFDSPAPNRGPFSVAPKTPPSLGMVQRSLLLDGLDRPDEPLARDLGPFARLAPGDPPATIAASLAEQEGALDEPSSRTRLADIASTSEAPPPPPPPFPTRSASPPPAPVPTAVAAAVDRLILRSTANPLGDADWRAGRAGIGAFYAERGFEPVWVDGNGLTKAGRAALAQLGRAAEDGLNLSALPLPKQAPAGLPPKDLAEAETAIAAAVVVYAEQASGSRIAPSRITPFVTAVPDVVDAAVALFETAAAPDPGARLAQFNPPQKGYRELREELKRLKESAPSRGHAALDISVDLAEQPLVGDQLPTDPTLESPHRASRSRGNRAYTASVDSVPRGSYARRFAAILANMEMWRWEPREMGVRRIEVNIPDYSVAVFDGDRIIHSARVVVGKPKTPTPIFSNVMRYVLINPSWQVPDSIVRKEILPRLGHFTNLGYEVRAIGGRITVRQPPGDDNALGRLAFMFPNEHSVYLHDTPAQELFAEDMRALSHGCVRVEDALRLAELVLRWPEARVNAAIGGPEQTVFLPQPLPIHIEYFTEFVDEDGILQERPDVYGLTHKVAGTLMASSQY
jgi:murein L,D-transpeptidase YcbB/YkuD